MSKLGKDQKSKKTTIYDIAAAVGTSAATVSRVLSNSGYPVKEEIRSRVLEAAKTLNYTPNMVGRMLKKSESMDIGVIIPTISNPFYPRLILGIELEARKRGYNIFLCNSFRDPATEKSYIDSLYQKQVKGVIISSIDGNQEFLNRMQQNGVKIVVFDQGVDGLENNKVVFDFTKGGYMAASYLIGMGHREIAFLTSPLTRRSRRQVMDGYMRALSQNGIAYRDDYIIASEVEEEYENGTYEFENGRKLAKRLLKLKRLPTAIFAVNDMTAFGIIHELLDNGLKVPEDISVMGFDNIEMASMITPPLTTVNQPAFDTGRLACQILLNSMNGDGQDNITITLEPALVERKSVKKL